MKFTKAQMQFLMSKFPQIDEVEFQNEAIEFVPKKKVMKEVPETERCTATKKDGERCTKRHIKDSDCGKCSIHSKATTTVSTKEYKPLVEKVRCAATTKKGEACKKNAVTGDYCNVHSKVPVETIAPTQVIVA